MEVESLDDFYRGGPATVNDAFPPACLRTHWDPTMVVKHVLPDLHVAAPLSYDPRPATRDCFFYNVGAPSGPAPAPKEPSEGLPPTPPQFLGGLHRPESSVGSGVMPPGGAASLGFPYSGFKPMIETDLLRVNEPATKCAGNRYIPTGGVPPANISDRSVPGSVPPREPPAPYSACRAQDDAAASARSSRLFFNPTRYDRTNTTPPGLYKPPSQGAMLSRHF